MSAAHHEHNLFGGRTYGSTPRPSGGNNSEDPSDIHLVTPRPSGGQQRQSRLSGSGKQVVVKIASPQGSPLFGLTPAPAQLAGQPQVVAPEPYKFSIPSKSADPDPPAPAQGRPPSRKPKPSCNDYDPFSGRDDPNVQA